jgi:Lipocalin-like domain
MRRYSMTLTVVGLAATATLMLGDVHPAASGAPSIEGVWSFVSETNTENGAVLHTDKDLAGIWIFAKTFYCLARMERNRAARSAAELKTMTPAEQVQYYQQLLQYASTAGSYRVSGNTLTRTWDISLGPEIIGQTQSARFAVEGDRLTVDLPRRSAMSGPASRVVYRRLE